MAGIHVDNSHVKHGFLCAVGTWRRIEMNQVRKRVVPFLGLEMTLLGSQCPPVLKTAVSPYGRLHWTLA